MAMPTVNEVMLLLAKKHAKAPDFEGQPVLRALVLALATVLVGREDDAGMEELAGTILHAVLPARARPAPRLMRLADEMARRIFAAEEPSCPLADFIGRDLVEHLNIPVDLDGIVSELRKLTHPEKE